MGKDDVEDIFSDFIDKGYLVKIDEIPEYTKNDILVDRFVITINKDGIVDSYLKEHLDLTIRDNIRRFGFTYSIELNNRSEQEYFSIIIRPDIKPQMTDLTTDETIFWELNIKGKDL